MAVNVVSLLDRRSQGLDPYWLLPKMYGTQKWTEISLSKNRGFQRFHNKGVTALDLETNNEFLISGNANGSIAIHDVQSSNEDNDCPLVSSITGSSIRSAHTRGISSIQWYPHDTGIFVSSSTDKSLRIWDTNEMIVVEHFKFPGPVYAHSMSSSHKHQLIAVGCGSSNNVTLCDTQTGSSTHILRRHTQPVTCLKWSPAADHLLATGSQDNRVYLWDIRKAAGPLNSLDQHNGGGASNTASVTTAHDGHITGVCFSDDGLFLVTMGSDQRARLWDIMTGINMLVNYGRVVHTAQAHPITVTPSTMAHRPHLFIPTRSDITMYELFTGKVVKKLKGHCGRVTECVASRDRFELYSGGADHNLLLWQLEPKVIVDSKQDQVSNVMSVYTDAWSDED